MSGKQQFDSMKRIIKQLNILSRMKITKKECRKEQLLEIKKSIITILTELRKQ